VNADDPVADLDGPAAIGGAMSKWPLRSLAWACRDERAAMADPAVVEMLLSRDAEDLGALADRAEAADIRTDALREKRRALERADPDDVMAALGAEYRAEYGGGGGGASFGDGCPFEESGLDKACWRCPVPGRAMDRLRDGDAGGGGR
jgi:hypothetical protein